MICFNLSRNHSANNVERINIYQIKRFRPKVVLRYLWQWQVEHTNHLYKHLFLLDWRHQRKSKITKKSTKKTHFSCYEAQVTQVKSKIIFVIYSTNLLKPTIASLVPSGTVTPVPKAETYPFPLRIYLIFFARNENNEIRFYSKTKK